MKYYSILFLLFFLFSCGQPNEQKDTAELTYREFYDLMFENYANRVEWHEDDFNQEAKAHIRISNRGECKSEHCGQKTFVRNTSTNQSIRVVIKTSFSIPNTLPYIANQFLLNPGEEVYLTCTQFCFNGETYGLDQSIVVAEFKAG